MYGTWIGVFEQANHRLCESKEGGCPEEWTTSTLLCDLSYPLCEG